MKKYILRKRGKAMKRWRKTINLSSLLTVALVVVMLAGFCPQGVNIVGLSIVLPNIKAAENINNPRIEKNSLMDSGQKVTWDCIYFGSYPQEEITVENGDIYETLKNTNGWNDSNDIIINNIKYRRLKGEDATDLSINYNWSDKTTYHYFKYEPIKWRVLSRNGSDAFLLSDVVLDDQKYNTNCVDVTWENSSMRSWLNGYDASENQPQINYTSRNFIDSAFSSAEKKAIKVTNVINSNNIAYNTEGGNNTSDKIFLLSDSEVYHTDKAYLYGFAKDKDSDEARECYCSMYAGAMGVNENTVKDYKGNVYWWLRSPGSQSSHAVEVDAWGWIERTGSDVDYCEDGVRPALHINLDETNLYSYAGTVCSDRRKVTEQPVSPSEPDMPSTEEKEQNRKQNRITNLVSNIKLSGISKQVAVGKKVILKAEVFPKNASNQKLLWKSSNPKVATVTQNGIVTLKKKTGGKKVTITATAIDGSGVSASWKIISMRGIVKKVKITGAKQVKAGKKLKLKAKVNATKKANTKILWTSSNPKAATVNAKGIVKAKKSAKGKTVKITAMATDGSNKKATIKVKIK